MSQAISARGFYGEYFATCEDILNSVDVFSNLLPAEQLGLFDEVLILKLIAKEHVLEWVNARSKKRAYHEIYEQTQSDSALDAYNEACISYNFAVKSLREICKDVREMATAASNVDKNMRETVAQGTLAYFVTSIMSIVANRYGYNEEFEQELRQAITIEKGSKASPYDAQFIDMIQSVPCGQN